MDPVSWVVIAGAALSAGASIKQGYDQRRALQWQSEQEAADAKTELSAAAVRADQIRKAAERQRGKTVGAIAASGVRIDSGTAGDAETYVTRTGEYDAMIEVISGSHRGRRLEAESQMSRIAGDNAMTSGWLSGAGSALSMYGIARGYIPSKQVTNPYRNRSSKNFGH